MSRSPSIEPTLHSAQFSTSEVVQDFFHRQFMIWKLHRVSSPTAIMVQKKYSIKACKHKSFTQKISCVQNMFQKTMYNIYIYIQCIDEYILIALLDKYKYIPTKRRATL